MRARLTDSPPAACDLAGGTVTCSDEGGTPPDRHASTTRSRWPSVMQGLVLPPIEVPADLSQLQIRLPPPRYSIDASTFMSMARDDSAQMADAAATLAAKAAVLGRISSAQCVLDTPGSSASEDEAIIVHLAAAADDGKALLAGGARCPPTSLILAAVGGEGI